MSSDLRISWSRIREWKSCRWRYNLNYERQLAPKITAEPLRDGSIFHECLAYIYERWPDVRTDLLQAKVKRCGLDPEVEEAMMGYVMTYIKHIRRHKTHEPDRVLAVEFPFEVALDMARLNERLPYPYPGRVTFIGIIDLLVWRRGRVEIWDHKLQSSMPSSGALDHPALSYPQAGLYPWASTYLGHTVNDFTLNVFSKRRSSNNIARFPTIVSVQEAAHWEEWLYDIIGEMISDEARTKNLGTLDCNWCWARYACSKHQQGGEPALQKALAAQYTEKEYRGRAPSWERSFPAEALEYIRSQ